MTGGVLSERRGSVWLLWLNSPTRRNALSLDMLTELHKFLTEIPSGINGIVLAGVGGHFSAGADFHDLSGTSGDIVFDDAVERVANVILGASVPIVAAVEGSCFGAAAHLALTCDARYAGQDSSLQIPAVALGLLYSPGALAFLAGAYRRDALRRLLLWAERFDAQDAFDAGFYSLVVPTSGAVEHAVSLLAKLPADREDALAATRGLLSALDEGTYVEEIWQKSRHRLLDTPQRSDAIARAKARHVDAVLIPSEKGSKE